MEPPPARRRVLFIEDEPGIRNSYARYFRPHLDVVLAGTGAEALEFLRAGRPDVVVLDLRLPDTDGVELLRRMRAIYPDLPVVITTAYMSIEPQLRALDLAFTDYLLKPFDLKDLHARLDAAG